MSTLTFSLELAQDLHRSSEQFPVSFDDSWQWLGYSRKDNAKTSFMRCGFVEGVDYQSLLIKETNQDGSFSHRREEITLTCECLKQWGMMAGTEKGREVRMYFLECEKIAKSIIQPTLPGNYLEALKSLVQAEEQKLLLQTINEQLEQENHLLAEIVDEVFGYSSIVRVAIFNGCSEKLFNWRKLKAASEVKKLEIKQAPCPRFEKKNLYSHDAWRYVYPDVQLPETTTLTIRSR
jgi:phage anti-repressor protein